MQYVDGHQLAHLIDSGPHPLVQIKQIALQLAEALAFAHANDVVHCNLSPHSVLVDRSNRVFVSDFGLAHTSRLHTGSSTNAAIFPNPTYMSPEQCLGKPVTPRTDQYLLGLVLYELLTCAPPFQGASAYQLMRQHCETPPPPIARTRHECPRSVAATVLRLMEKDPQKRFQFTSEVVRAIASWPSYETQAIPVVPQSREDLIMAVATARRSLDHASCVGEPYQPGSLFVEFYRLLMEEPSIGPHLGGLNFDRQVRTLGAAITALLEYAMRPAEIEPHLARMAQAHLGLSLPQELFESFVATFARVVVRMDPTLADEAMAENVRVAWEIATQPGLSRIIELTRATAPGPQPFDAANMQATERDSGLRLAAKPRAAG
jgi:serine/threonine protein kinase